MTASRTLFDLPALPGSRPTCDHCGGRMELIAVGGEMKDPTSGKWVPSNRETWRCVSAFTEFRTACRQAERQLREKYGDHLRPLTRTKEARR